MATGEPGVSGASAPSHVTKDCAADGVFVTIPAQCMAGRSVLETIRNIQNARWGDAATVSGWTLEEWDDWVGEKKKGGGGTKRQAMWYDAPAASEVDFWGIASGVSWGERVG